MSYLSELPDDVRRLVISLPFRVGYFLSVSDQSGGDEAFEAEQRALANIVTFFVEDTIKSEFANEVMIETLNHRAQWDAWKKNIVAVPDECEVISKMLGPHIDEKEIFAYKQNLLDVAVAVAEAYCETPETQSKIAHLSRMLQQFINRMAAQLGGITPWPEKAQVNISRLEQQAIDKLAGRMSISYKQS